ncbi:hypothetical protein P171DRAFT_488457 [Karstenula rhodostoma CBS 690.94]|uniref:Uncharacterized protein n=1 Tax=Karstenula rhodostoma CBS 690.94 TaxID=1392251 RepID=A0A9P4U8H2_9PLEO|nr:hypothetical protein P171DRAFT_488457 [Karstenula rhodostoma CBS 690.94]
MGLEVLEWLVHKLKYTYKSHKQRHHEFYPPPDPSNVIGNTALMPAHEQPSFGGGTVRGAQAGSARPTLVRLPSVRSMHASIEDASDCISSADSGVEVEDASQCSDEYNFSGVYAPPRENGSRAGHVEKPGNFEMKRSNAVRRKASPYKPTRPTLRPKIQQSDRPFSFLCPTESLPGLDEKAPSQSQLKRNGAIRRKMVPKTAKCREAAVGDTTPVSLAVDFTGAI